MAPTKVPQFFGFWNWSKRADREMERGPVIRHDNCQRGLMALLLFYHNTVHWKSNVFTGQSEPALAVCHAWDSLAGQVHLSPQSIDRAQKGRKMKPHPTWISAWRYRGVRNTEKIFQRKSTEEERIFHQSTKQVRFLFIALNFCPPLEANPAIDPVVRPMCSFKEWKKTDEQPFDVRCAKGFFRSGLV